VATFLTEQFILTCENCNPSHLACYAAKTYTTTSRSGVSDIEKEKKRKRYLEIERDRDIEIETKIPM
jgi:hypothetical protein